MLLITCQSDAKQAQRLVEHNSSIFPSRAKPSPSRAITSERAKSSCLAHPSPVVASTWGIRARADGNLNMELPRSFRGASAKTRTCFALVHKFKIIRAPQIYVTSWRRTRELPHSLPQTSAKLPRCFRVCVIYSIYWKRNFTWCPPLIKIWNTLFWTTLIYIYIYIYI